MEAKKRQMENLSNFYKNKKVLITGVTGFKGAWLAHWLLYFKASLVGLGHNPNKNKNLFYQLNLQSKLRLYLFDIRNKKKLEKIINKHKPSIIFHLAAQPLIYESYKNPYKTFDVNYRGTLNLMEIIRKSNFVKSLVVATSDKCYEDSDSSRGFKETDALGGIDPYSASKSSTEIMIRAFRESFFLKKSKIGISTGRAGNVIGGGDWSPNRLIPDCIKSLIKGKVILLRNPNFNRPWQHVLEPLKGYLFLAKKQFYRPLKYSGAWNFGTNPSSLTTVKRIVEYIIQFWGTGNLKIKKNNYYEQKNLQLNINKAKKILKWFPTYNIKKGVTLTAQWYYRVIKLKQAPEKVSLDQIKKYMDDSKIS